MSVTPQKDIYEMSDEEILNMAPPAIAGGAEASSDAPPVVEATKVEAPEPEAPATETEGAEQETSQEKAEETNGVPSAEAPEPVSNPGSPEGQTPGAVVPNTEPVSQTPAAEPDKGEAKSEASGSTSSQFQPPSAEEAQAFFMKVMAPFKANGRQVQLKNPEEAISLMQMGANYTRKMQELQPHKKLLIMLQDNGLEDPAKLSYLIDLDKKDPAAIRQLIKDSGIDPLDINTSEAPNYQAGSHTVTDEEATFRSALEEVSAQPQGQETLALIQNKWDETSKEFLWKNPSVLGLIQSQRESGVYDQITDEIERQSMLGGIPSGTPFIQTYQRVGEELKAKGAFGTPAPAPKAVPLDTRPALPKAPADNGEQVRAATPPRQTARPAKEAINYLAMSDDDFLKQMNGRV